MLAPTLNVETELGLFLIVNAWLEISIQIDHGKPMQDQCCCTTTELRMRHLWSAIEWKWRQTGLDGGSELVVEIITSSIL